MQPEIQLQTHTLPGKFDQLEHWWRDLPSYARWFTGCISAAVLIGITGGLMA
ncbi:MAG: hypothetical protein R3E82_08110 [Pseudomonadales bacterium]|nr:hypothetical protein [Pseudomonadales bacterium]